MVRGRRSARPRAALVGVVAAGALLALGCSAEKRALRDIEQSYQAEDYRETVALCRHAIRRNLGTAEVYYYYGAALVSMNRDFEGFRQFELATQQDPALVSESVGFLVDRARTDFDEGRRRRAARRFRQALELDPALELAGHRFLVADLEFEEGNFAQAAHLYRGAIAAHPDTSACVQAYARLAAALTETGETSAARETLEELLTRYPRGSHKLEAKWRLSRLMFEEAEKQFTLGNYDSTVEQLELVLETTSNHGLAQQSRFLLGETYEAMGDFGNAYSAYRSVIEEDRGASGRIVERAREKIDAMRQAGLD